jgi:hypothetical protein
MISVICWCACYTTRGNDQAPTYSLCEIVRNPAKFDKKIVHTRAIFFSNTENQVLYDPDCDEDDVSIWAAFGDSYTYSSEETKVAFNQLLCPTPSCLRGKVAVEIVGRFDSTDNNGYGHLSAYRFRFVIMQIKRAETVTRDSPRRIPSS